MQTKDNRPSLGQILDTYSRLTYKITTALSEFVDNSTANYYLHKKRLEDSEKNFVLQVKIDYLPSLKTLTITDNAIGMDESELENAMRISHRPVIQNGRNEFGMGLKTSASWFSKKWKVVTKKLGSNFEYTAAVDIEDLKKNKVNYIEITKKPKDPTRHYTKIEMYDLERKIISKTLETLANDLASIYRKDVSSGKVEIFLNKEKATYTENDALVEIINGKEITWKKKFSDSVVNDELVYPLNGFIGVLKNGTYDNPGLTLLRSGRVIVGATKYSKFKPEEIFGKPNSYKSFRIFGEIELDSWPVTQAKDDFDWETNGLKEQFFTKLLELGKDMFEKAEDYRVEKVKKITEKNITEFGESTQSAIKNIQLTDIKSLDSPLVVQRMHDVISYSIGVKVKDTKFSVTVNFIEFDDSTLFKYEKKDNKLVIKVNVKLPFFAKNHEDIDFKYLQTIQKFIVILVISEQWTEMLSDQKGYIMSSAIRDSINLIIDSIENKEGSYDE